ncbi:MAG: class I SAM-dependent methyltransferase [Candidatus Microthrix sp.]|jgi:hypothetical protein|nr:class I SAM-dependent methyltransferase [Candidatus Microthrix sp.]MBP9066170.1 class I SAM-dependent methyltransferase [Candidatus Microthrix sp.]
MKSTVKRLVSRSARFLTNEIADELERRAAQRPLATAFPRTKIDIPDAVAQLGSAQSRVQLHQLMSWNHRWVAMLAERNRRTAVSSYDFIEEVMPNARFSINQFDVIRDKQDEIMQLDGHILDLGVYRGVSTKALARIFPSKIIHGFDSFEGLPEDWGHQGKGAFGEVKGMLPDMPDNVKLYKGWFDDTLPDWYSAHNGTPISLLRVDCDLYSSTRTILNVLRPLIRSGTWIVFDEYIGYRTWEEHEYKAFMEFVDETGFEFEYVAYGLTYTILRLL